MLAEMRLEASAAEGGFNMFKTEMPDMPWIEEAAIDAQGIASALLGDTLRIDSLRIRDDGVGDTGFLLGLTLSDNAVTSPCCTADWNADGTLDPDDLADLIACFFSGGCPRGGRPAPW